MILVGDNVEIIENIYSKDKFIITKVYDRKNFIPRPKIANIDILLILIAPLPKPDFLLVDKLLIYCEINNIHPIIVINKCDIASADFVNSIKDEYKYYDTFVISAKDLIATSDIYNVLKGKTTAVCGQSAVGKSSLINCLIPNIQLQTQGLSEKICRGKHTTRVNQIFLNNDFFIADTPGFSSLDLNIDFRQLSFYYPEFKDFIQDCRYVDCSHIKEGDFCGVCVALNQGKINKNRYQRYIELYKKLKENWEKKYD